VLEILNPGTLATIQDCGRYGYRRYGVPLSGAMDNFALRVANLLVGNSEKEAGLEVTFGMGFKMKAHEEVFIALTGGDLSPRINNASIPMWAPFWMKKNDILTLSRPRSGLRAYLAIRGGMEVPLRMNSYSPMIASPVGILKSGDRLKIAARHVGGGVCCRSLPDEFIPAYGSEIRLRILWGPQKNYFTPDSLDLFLRSEYAVTPQSNRQGYRLEGPALKHVKTHDIISEPVWPGSIQVPGDGLPIILGNDAQTTGGYPKIAAAISADLDKLGQAKPADRIFFEEISIDEAHQLYRRKEERIRKIKEIFQAAAHV